MKYTHCDMRFGQIGGECHSLFSRLARLRQLRFGQGIGQPMLP